MSDILAKGKFMESAVGIQNEGDFTCVCSLPLLPFPKQKLSPILDPFSFYCQLPLSFSLAYLLRENPGVGEVTQLPVRSPAHIPAGIFPGTLCFLINRQSVTVLLTVSADRYSPTYHVVIISCYSFSFSIS